MNRNKHVSQDVLATKGLRFANFIIDYIAIIAFSTVIGIVIGIISGLVGSFAFLDFLESNVIVEYLFGYLIWLVYYLSFEFFLKGRSIGKWITKTKVVTHDGLEPSFETILVRSLCRFIPFEQFSFLGTDGKGWHDSISKTYVVEVKKFEEKIETEFELDQIGKLPE
ncbi:MAG: RDD family protein [Winogradskyella sp.]|uniref:RDD family protein n=1 Tax=Winogradskyella sp. TaxID=1883156 RepID=UPI0025DB6812|nr:RDD family protein [Winogradskyella sp.]NRB59833.1 RDD family protein [Winogradskyella sp.]